MKYSDLRNKTAIGAADKHGLPEPLYLYSPDKELQEKIEQLLSEMSEQERRQLWWVGGRNLQFKKVPCPAPDEN
ncbi:MAG: hypothetical protein LBR06_10850 [Bacteroidales bacterium]|jgi:hypothetical protein|nr:hypothetical protein [Bacteroidales bacterium]